MKIIAMFAAGALAVGTIAAVPAEAQRHGWQGDQGRGWQGDRGRGDRWHGDRGFRGQGYGGRGYGGRGYGERGYGGRGDGYRGYRGGYRGDYGYGGYRGGYGRSRVVCRVQRGYYGPVRRCFRVYR